MVLGNMMNQSGQQYVAIKDDKNTWTSIRYLAR